MHDDGHQGDSRTPGSPRERKLRTVRERAAHLKPVPDDDSLRLIPPGLPSRTMGRLIAQTALLADSATASSPPAPADVPPPVRERRPRRDRGRFGWFL